MLKPFLRRSQKIQWKENHTVATLWKPIRSGLNRFFSGSLQRKPFAIIWDKYSSRQTNPSLKDLARQGLISFTKHQRPISGEDLEVLYAANQFGLNAPESFANSFSTSEREAVKPTRDETRWPLAQNSNNRLKYFISSERATKNQSTFKCYRFKYRCKFWDWNTFLSSQVYEQYVGKYEPKAPSFRVFDPRGVTKN